MTQDSMPWDGTLTGDAGPYSADEWTRIWRNIDGLGSGVGGANDSGIVWGSGVYPDVGLTVTPNTPAGQSVLVTAGSAFVHGAYYVSDATVTLTVNANVSGNTRIDTVVLQKNWAAKTIRLVVKQGTPAASPVPPGLTQSSGSTWEIPIADLTLANGFATITATSIRQRYMYRNVAPFDVIENVQNASGITSNPGDVAVFATVAGQVTTSALKGAPVAGVWADVVPNGGVGRLIRRGKFPVRLSGAAAVNQAVIHEANVVASIPTTGQGLWNSFAVTLEATGGAGLCMCYIDCTLPKGKFSEQKILNQAGFASTTMNTWVNVDATMAISIFTTTGRVWTEFTFPGYMGVSSAGTHWCYYNLILDGVTQATANANGLHTFDSFAAPSADRSQTFHVGWLWKGLTPGVHSVALQYKGVLGTGTGPTMGINSFNGNGGHSAVIIAVEQDAPAA